MASGQTIVRCRPTIEVRVAYRENPGGNWEVDLVIVRAAKMDNLVTIPVVSGTGPISSRQAREIESILAMAVSVLTGC